VSGPRADRRGGVGAGSERGLPAQARRACPGCASMCGRKHGRGETTVPGCIERGWRSS